ncbi:MAG: RluA family pseudouridine synthase [Vagococcus sp.]|nr:RluA family pseudouridine synthase [Vagococcus sp.]
MDFLVHEQAERLDIWLSEQMKISRSQAQKKIKEKEVKVNGTVINKPSTSLFKSDVVVVFDNNQNNPFVLEPKSLPLEIVLEDEFFLIVNKPQNLIVYPTSNFSQDTLVNRLLAYTTLAEGTAPERPGIVHRLDKDTSGLILVAKTNIALQALIEMFKNRSIKKIYWAIVNGIPKKSVDTISIPLKRQKNNRLKMAPSDHSGKESITHYKLCGYNQNEQISFLEIEIETGTMHQIRAHLAILGLPILGDWLYGNKKNSYGFTGQALHAQRLVFKHPFREEIVDVKAQPPNIFLQTLKHINNN